MTNEYIWRKAAKEYPATEGRYLTYTRGVFEVLSYSVDTERWYGPDDVEHPEYWAILSPPKE